MNQQIMRNNMRKRRISREKHIKKTDFEKIIELK
jgi:hypothetical protein